VQRPARRAFRLPLVDRFAFEDAKQLAGVGEARNRTELAVKRTVPFGLLC
jgi:hypothetical protein